MIQGNGSIGIEILEQVPDVDAVIVTCGGGGLLAGVCTVIKELKPNCQVIVKLPLITLRAIFLQAN